ncbi:MAG: insulinase family protein [Bacteriovoracaceae bacterium]|nr:insulinase family protein [Bacteriovoracaceae bacterium]
MSNKLNIKTLNNNLPCLFVHSPGSTSASVQIWFRAGSALEKEEHLGIAHFLEHMFFKGTPTRPGSQIAHQVESYGGEVNAFTSFDYTCYYINTPNTHLQQTINILMDMVSNPEFKNEELIPERGVVFEEFRRSIDNPSQFHFFELQKTSFPHGYSHAILGNEKTIKNFTREQIISFRKNFYNTKNALLVIAGNITDQTKLESIIETYKMPNGEATTFPEFKLKAKSTVNTHHKDVRQSALTIAIQAYDYENRFAAAEDLAVNCLAYGETSRLYKKLVLKKPIASSLSGSSMYFADGGTHFIKISFPEENTKLILDNLYQVLKETADEGFEEAEVSKIKNQYIASKIFEKESNEAYAFSLGHGFAQNGDIYCEEKFIDRIKNVTSGQVNQAFKRIISRAFHISIQTPKNISLTTTQKLAEGFLAKVKKIVPDETKAAKTLPMQTSKFDPATQVLDIKPGVQLIYRKNTITPTFVFHAYCRGGVTQETKDTCGTHYLISRLLTYGYAGFPYNKLKDELENKSASLNGFSGKNAYGLTMHGLTEHFNELCSHFMGSLLQPEFPSKYLSLEKQLVKRALENHKEDPVKQCFKAVNKMVFQDHPYALDVIGNERSLPKLGQKNLRSTHMSNMKKQKLVFTYCGDMELSDLLDVLNPYFEKLTSRKDIPKKFTEFKSESGKRLDIKFEREQTQIFIGAKAFRVTDKEDIYLKMLSAHLSGQSSELFVEVRDKQGLCYAVQPVHHTALEGGYWGIYIAAGHDKTDAAVKAILGIMNKLKNNGLTKEEVDRIKTMMDGQNLINIQTNDDYAGIYSIPLLQNLGLDLEHITNQKINQVTQHEFNAFLKSYLATDWNIVKVGRV